MSGAVASRRGVAIAERDRSTGSCTSSRLVGGPAAVSDAVVAEVEGIVGAGSVIRYGGATRYHTAVQIARALWNDPNQIILANGQSWPDAVAGSSLSALHTGGAPLLLTPSPNWDEAANGDSQLDEDPNRCQEGNPCDPRLHPVVAEYLDRDSGDPQNIDLGYVLGRHAAIGWATFEDVNCLLLQRAADCVGGDR